MDQYEFIVWTAKQPAFGIAMRRAMKELGYKHKDLVPLIANHPNQVGMYVRGEKLPLRAKRREIISILGIDAADMAAAREVSHE